MLQFLIRRTDGPWFEIPDERFEEVVRPHSVPSTPILGRDVYRIGVQGCELSFSFEEPGIQVVVESGEMTAELAKRLVDEISASITEATGQKSEVIQLA